MAFSTGFAEPSDLPQDPDEFEDYVKQLLEKNYGYKVIKPPKNQHGYDLDANQKKWKIYCGTGQKLQKSC